MLALGLRGHAAVDVVPANTAAALRSGDVPVFGTPALVALMEQAAVAALAGHLEPGETTVGTRIDVAHLAATPVGERVRAEAVLIGLEGRSLRFAVVAFDGRQKVGEGVHQRAVVGRERFLAKLPRPA